MRVGVNITPLKTAHKLRGIGYYTYNLINTLKKDPTLELVEFTKLSELNNVDLVHYPWFDFYFHTLPIIKKFKTVVTIHDVIPLLFPQYYPAGFKGKINFTLQKLSLKNTSEIITDSNSSRRDIIRILKINENKVSSVPLAVENEFKLLNGVRLMQYKRKFNLPDNFILYVGDANWVKNLPFLIEGFSKLIEKKDYKDLHLVLVGGVFLKNVEGIDHPELESLKRVNRLIAELRLDHNVIKLGRMEKEDLVAIYNLATVYVQPSIYEGFGLPVLEALSCGTPVICSNGGSLEEVGGNAVVYFNPNNIVSFVKVLDQVLQDISLQKKLSDLGLKRAAEFTWEQVARETKQIYIKALNVK